MWNILVDQRDLDDSWNSGDEERQQYLRDRRRLANASRGPRRVRQYDRFQSRLAQFSLKGGERTSEEVVIIVCWEQGVIADSCNLGQPQGWQCPHATIGTLGDLLIQSRKRNLRLAYGTRGFAGHREAIGELSILA